MSPIAITKLLMQSLYFAMGFSTINELGGRQVMAVVPADK